MYNDIVRTIISLKPLRKLKKKLSRSDYEIICRGVSLATGFSVGAFLFVRYWQSFRTESYGDNYYCIGKHRRGVR